MASSGSFSTNTAGYGGGYPNRATFSWWTNSRDINNNTTTIGFKVIADNGSSGWYQWFFNPVLYVNGVQYTADSAARYNGDTIISGTLTIPHNSDGSKSFSASFSCNIYSSSGNVASGSGSWALDTIPRCSTGSFDKSSYTIGDAIRINFNRNSSAFTHNGYIQFPDRDGWIWAGEKYFSGAGTNYTWTPSAAEIDALYARIPNATSATMFADCKTMNGGTEIGQFSVGPATLAIDTNVCKPVFSKFTYKDTNATAVAVTSDDQILIQGVSELEVDITATNKAIGQKSASINTYEASISGLSKSASYSSSADVAIKGFGTSLSPGTQALTVKAIDSRGLSAAVTENVLVLAYSSPVVSATATRLNNFENDTTLHIDGSISPLNDGINNLNTIKTLKYRYKKQSTSTWGSWITRTNWKLAEDGTISLSDVVLNFDNTDGYNLEIAIEDKIRTTTVAINVSVGIPVFRIGTDGNVYNNEKRLVPYDEIIKYTTHVGQVIMTTELATAAQVANVYGGTWIAWGGGRVPVGVGSNGTTNYKTVGATGGEEKHTLSVAEMPSHTHAQNEHSHTTYNRWNSFAAGNLSGYGFTSPANGWAQDGWQQDYTGGTTATNQNTGGGGAHNNMQPYITVYFWKRTA